MSSSYEQHDVLSLSLEDRLSISKFIKNNLLDFKLKCGTYTGPHFVDKHLDQDE